MLYVYIIRDETGAILSLNATTGGVVAYMVGTGDAVLPDGTVLTVDALDEALERVPSVEVTYQDAPPLTVECHAVLV